MKTAAELNAQLAQKMIDLVPLDDEQTVFVQVDNSRIRCSQKNVLALAEKIRKSHRTFPAGVYKRIGPQRHFPAMYPGMTTKEYVMMFQQFNNIVGDHVLPIDFEALGDRPAALYENGALDFDVIEEPIDAPEIGGVAAVVANFATACVTVRYFDEDGIEESKESHFAALAKQRATQDVAQVAAYNNVTAERMDGCKIAKMTELTGKTLKNEEKIGAQPTSHPSGGNAEDTTPPAEFLPTETIRQWAGSSGQGLGYVSAKIEASKARKENPNCIVTIENAGWLLKNGDQALKVVTRKSPATTPVAVSTDYAGDVPMSLAVSAYNGVSFSIDRLTVDINAAERLQNQMRACNQANIRRMRERLEKITAAKARPVERVECANGVTLEDDAPANRVKLFFPGKPPEAIRSELKSSGFRWAPSVGAWQAYRNSGTLATAKRLAGEPVADVAADVVADVEELATVADVVAMGGTPGTPGTGTPGHTGHATPATAHRHSTPGAAGGAGGQRIAGKSGQWVATFHTTPAGLPGMVYTGPDGQAQALEFSTGRERMATLQRLAREADKPKDFYKPGDEYSVRAGAWICMKFTHKKDKTPISNELYYFSNGSIATAVRADELEERVKPIGTHTPHPTGTQAAEPAPVLAADGADCTDPLKTLGGDYTGPLKTLMCDAHAKTPNQPRHPRNIVPENGVRIAEDAFEAWNYHHEKSGRFGFVMYLGKQSKPYAYYGYATEAKRDAGFERHAQQARDIFTSKVKRKAEDRVKLDAGHGLQVGDVVRSSWGYDQTNVDHYQITKVIGKRTVEVRALAVHEESTGDMSGRVAPVWGEFVGDVMRRQVDKYGNVNILSASYGRASKIDPVAVVHGVRCYAASGYSSYA